MDRRRLVTVGALLSLLTACDARRAAPEPAWRVVETLRLGGDSGSGATLFGRIFSFDVDAAGRLWVLDGRAQEVRVFDPTGHHIRTVGRAGNGPGEFVRAVRIERGPRGHLWVTDPSNSRLSEFDTSGTFLRAVTVPLGCFEIPWPGRFDVVGRYHAVASPECASILRFSPEFSSRVDLVLPTNPRTPDYFVVNSPSGELRAEIPYQGTLAWRIAPTGRVWAMMTNEYRIFEFGSSGDTLRALVREVTRESLTDADRAFANTALKWFVDAGGRADLSRLPRRRPPVVSFFFADDGTLWVQRFTAPDSLGYIHDLFDPDGRFLGVARLPFPLALGPALPIVRDNTLYGLTDDSLGVQSLVRARIEPPGRP